MLYKNGICKYVTGEKCEDVEDLEDEEKCKEVVNKKLYLRLIL
jgi:hypothetical protein